MSNSETPAPAPFTFKAAQQKPTKPEAEAPKRARKLREVTEPPVRRKRRARASSDVLVLKACLRQLRTLDPKDAWRTIETLRVLFK